MRTLNLRIIGTTPLLLHKISNHRLREQLVSDIRHGTIEEEAEKNMSVDFDDNPAVPVSWISNSMRSACSHIVIDGKQLSFVELQSKMTFLNERMLVKDTNGNIPAWTVYKSVQHQAPGSKKMILIVAPMFREWELRLTVSVEESIVDILISKVFPLAGKVGIGLFHPPKKQFGKFRVEF